LSTRNGRAYRAAVLATGDVLATTLLSVALFILLGPQFATLGAPGLVAAQLACFALPALALSRARTGRFAAVGLTAFPPLALIGTALIAITMWIWVVHWIAPLGVDWASPEQTAQLEAVFALPTRPLWQSLLFFAVVPAFCEELLHRGMLLPALCKRLGPVPGLVLGALLFGLSHFNLSRLLPTAVLGLAAGGLRLRTGSLWPSMALHAVYNGSLLIAAHASISPQGSWALPALLLTAIGVALVAQATKYNADLVS
tara:strand:+ start:161 stop:928 length:768 start_codon:yes stop_codon:yes gene_type:complete